MFRKFWAWYKRPNKTTFEQYVETFIVIVPLAFVIRTYFYGLYQVPTGSMEVTMLVGERFFADKFTILFSPPKRGDIISFNDPDYNYSKNPLMRLYEHYVWGPSNWTKRVIGVPGDHVKGVIENGKPEIYINGQKLDQPFINPYQLIAEGTGSGGIRYKTWDPNYSYENQPFYRLNEYQVFLAKKLLRQHGLNNIKYPYEPEGIKDEYDIHLGPNEYWVLGDNRRGSNDSRFFGKLDGSLIHGKIVWRILSIDSKGGNFSWSDIFNNPIEYLETWLVFDIILHPIDFWSRVRWSRFFQPVR
ncbi:MAG: signal peptidase I [Candidatus Babeliales bacterium]